MVSLLDVLIYLTAVCVVCLPGQVLCFNWTCCFSHPACLNAAHSDNNPDYNNPDHPASYLQLIDGLNIFHICLDENAPLPLRHTLLQSFSCVLSGCLEACQAADELFQIIKPDLRCVFFLNSTSHFSGWYTQNFYCLDHFITIVTVKDFSDKSFHEHHFLKFIFYVSAELTDVWMFLAQHFEICRTILLTCYILVFI